MVDLISVSGIAVIPIVVAATQAVKMALHDRFSNWAPLISILLGIIASFLINRPSMTFGEIVFAGALYGLSASGLYSGTRATSEAIKGER